MVLGRVGADDDDEIGILALVEGRGHRGRADAFEQRRHRRGVAQPRAVVDVVGAEAGADQLLEQIGLFVRALGRAEAGQRARPVAVADFLQAGGGALHRLFPGRFAEMRPRVCRIDQIVGGFADAVLAHHRLRQALRIADVVEAEAALDAEPVLVGRAVAADHVDELVVLDLVGELAADAAIGADAVDLAVGEFGAHVVLVRPASPASARRSGRPARIRRRRRRSRRPSGRRSRTRSFRRWPRPAMPMTSLTCTSRQARTQRLHWMQASRLTAMAGWLRSGGGTTILSRLGKRLGSTLCRLHGLPEFRHPDRARPRSPAGR